MVPYPLLAAFRVVGRGLWVTASAILVAGMPAAHVQGQVWPVPQMPPLEVGRVLFARQWQELDARSVAGDGLGPMFNGRSCAECHHQGGTGGSGSPENNVDLLCLVPLQTVTRIDRRQFVAEASRVHAGFFVNESTALPTITLHRSSTHPAYTPWREALLSHVDGGPQRRRGGWMRLRRFERRTPSLFGAGLIDAIPPEVLRETAARQGANGGIRGRLALASDGGVGKFGWRGQTATLHQFVVGACANELGLHVPGTAQPRDPLNLSATAPGLDLNEQQCQALTAFVASLPAPAAREPASESERKYWSAGQRQFERIGCAVCHPPNLGEAAGIYSDLLLHDMGPTLSDPAGANPPGRSGMTVAFDATKYYGGLSDVFVAVPPETQRQWRTPPLWGLADSGPYLHDGRARTVEAAILAHGGEARSARGRYVALRAESRAQLLAFLFSAGVPHRAPTTRAALALTRP